MNEIRFKFINFFKIFITVAFNKNYSDKEIKNLLSKVIN